MWMDINISFKKFSAIGRNRPGTLIEVIMENGKKKHYLIGDVNPSGAIESGGMPFSSKAIISRYRILWSR